MNASIGEPEDGVSILSLQTKRPFISLLYYNSSSNSVVMFLLVVNASLSRI